MAIVTGGFERGRRGRGAPALAEINVTPFVDVALVLLIIFMITAHVMEYGIEINVPKTRTVAAATKERPVITISKTGDMFLGKNSADINRIVSDIRARYPGQDAVYLRADAATQWDIIAQVTSVLSAAKIGIAIVTQPNGKP